MSTQTERNDDSDAPGLLNVDLPNAGLPNVNISTIDKRWISQDLQSLKTGLFADAEIICEGDATPRKVHRNTLANRSNWFKTAFTGDFEEAKKGKVHLQESPWQVDLMLYFLYSGGIDLNDEALTNGHDVMDISVELMRLGDFFQSTEMQLYGKNMLAEYLRNFLSRICSSASIFANSPGANEELFNAETNFPQRFCSAVINAFNKERPVKLAQDILADFAFAARIHLFKNHEFLSFIRDEVAPEFGNRVLAAQMDGSVSDVFKGSSVFKHWKDWRVTPTMGTSSKSQGSGLFGTASPGSASASSTASPFGGGVGLFGGNSSAGTYTSVGSTGQTGGFGSTGTNAGGGLFGSNDVTKPPGTVGPAFSPYQENEPNSTTVNSFQSILFHDQYKKFSAEELRMADYSQGRRYGNGQTGGSGGFGTTSGSGRGLFGNTITQNTSFGNTNNAGGGFSFGTATPK